MWRKPGDPDPSPPRPQQSESQTCPFCRTEIKGREVVSIHQFQERPAEEARAAAEALAYSSDQEVGEEELGQVTPSPPPLPPRLDLFPDSPRSKGQLKVVSQALVRGGRPGSRPTAGPRSGSVLILCT